MKIPAGGAFHHRKPKQAPIAAAAISVEVERVADGVAVVDRVASTQLLRNCQYAMIT